jgi:energy-coupling factor transporter ATP-binding protein EcfA2
MYIREIQIENIRGFGEGAQGVSLDLTRPDGSLAGWTVIAGRNGTGKTTLLRAIALSVIGPVASAVLHGSFAGWIKKGVQAAEVRARIEYDGADRIEGDGKLPASGFWTGLRWEQQTSGPEPKLRAQVKYFGPKRFRVLELGPWSDNPQGWFIAGYGPFRRLSGHASDAQQLMSGAPRTARLVSLFREDASLVESMQWFREAYIRRIDHVSKHRLVEAAAQMELNDNVVALLNDGLLPDGAQIEDYDAEGLLVRQGDVVLRLDQLSDGYRTVTALVLDITSQLYRSFGEFKIKKIVDHVQVPYSGVVLIDEIDVHLHIEWQKRIGFWFKKHFPNIQFIVTTHSPFICQAADPNGIIRLPSPGDPRPAAPVSEEVYNIVVNGSADDAVMTELFGGELPYSDRAEALREEISALESQVIEGGVTQEEKTRLKNLSAKLPRTPSAEVERALLKLSAQLGAKPKVKAKAKVKSR